PGFAIPREDFWRDWKSNARPQDYEGCPMRADRREVRWLPNAQACQEWRKAPERQGSPIQGCRDAGFENSSGWHQSTGEDWQARWPTGPTQKKKESASAACAPTANSRPT